MADLRERVARAMFPLSWEVDDTGDYTSSYLLREMLLNHADAAIAECRKETDALVEALEWALDLLDVFPNMVPNTTEHRAEARALLASLKTPEPAEHVEGAE